MFISGRYQAGVAAANGLVYAIGGCDSWNCLNSVEIYDPEINSWKFAPPMTTLRRGCGAAFFNGIYMILKFSQKKLLYHRICLAITVR